MLSHPAGADDAADIALAGRDITEDKNWFVPHNTANFSNQNLLFLYIVARAATELSYFRTSPYMKDVTTENNWTSELVVEIGIDNPIQVKIGFLQRDQINQQHQNNDTFHRPRVVKAQCITGITGSEKDPDARKNCKYAIKKNSQAYDEIVSCFRHLAKDNILQP